MRAPHKPTPKKDRKMGVEMGIAPERLPSGDFAADESEKERSWPLAVGDPASCEGAISPCRTATFIV